MDVVVGKFCLAPFLTGCGMSAALIIAIGAQNAFVLKQGIMRNHVFATAMFCAVADGLLIVLGVHGFGQVILSNIIFMEIAKWAGALFLFLYGFKSFYQMRRPGKLHMYLVQEKPSIMTTFSTLFIVTFLNPHAYLDTVVLLGSVGSQFPQLESIYFTAGAVLISFVWFFGVSYGARLLEPYFKSDFAWRLLDFLIGCTMWAIAISILLPSGCLCF